MCVLYRYEKYDQILNLNIKSNYSNGLFQLIGVHPHGGVI